jgi:hypothetical protein
MVLTRSELVAALQREVRILLHLAGKIDRTQLDYRPTPKQRSTIELLRYLTVMGPAFVQAAKAGSFDRSAWTVVMVIADARDVDQTLAAIGSQHETFAALLADVGEADLRTEVDIFGNRLSRGAFIVFAVLGGFAAYRTQLFLYLKACGGDDLNTMNLWAGADASAAPER